MPKNTKSSKKYNIAIDESAETVEKEKTTINNIVMYYHDEATHRTKCTRNALYSYFVSELKHIQEDCKVKTYVPRESANQNVATVGEREMMKIRQSHQS